MIRNHLRPSVPTAILLLVLALPATAHAATRYVADNGDDGPVCGMTAKTACRSITHAIALAAVGDTISVGPGRYGDLNRNGVLGDMSGEETGSPGCGCVLSINKNVIVVSSGGAAVTMIDGRSVDVGSNVILITNGGEFGRTGKGFTVTETAYQDAFDFLGNGIAIDSANVTVAGNQVVFTGLAVRLYTKGIGILIVNDAPILIEGNQVIGWQIGITARSAVTVNRNQVSHNEKGILAIGGSVAANVVTANWIGIEVTGSSQVVGNAVNANGLFFGGGIIVNPPFSGVITKNNLLGNHYVDRFGAFSNCGLANRGAIGVNAKNNYWGAPTGPGAPEGDTVCNFSDGSTIHTPFAKKPFAVKILKP